MTSIFDKYNKEIATKMIEKFGYKNIMAVPKIEKVVLNTGFGKQILGKSSDEVRKIYDNVIEEIGVICGQKPVLTKAKKSISTFKLRQGTSIGAMVTLRGKRMRDFVERLVSLALPRTRDFRGLDPKSVDKSGNLTVAIREHIVFPEIVPEKAKNIFSFEATIVTSAKTKEEGFELLKLMGFPFK